VVTKVNKQADGTVTYDVSYDDGDFEDDIEPENVRPVEKTSEEKGEEETHQEGELAIRRKRQNVKEKARYV
jgi:nucleolar protein 14